MAISHGRANPAFSKPCLCPSDTLRRFRGSDERSPCFQWVECKFAIFAVFVETAHFWRGTKTRFTKNTVCATANFGPERKNLAPPPPQILRKHLPNPASPLRPPARRPPPLLGFSIKCPSPSRRLRLPLLLPEQKKIKNIRNVHQEMFKNNDMRGK